MHFEEPKVLQKILDKPMINIIIKELNKINIEQNFLIVGYKKELVQNEVEKNFTNITFCEQTDQLGTAHAVMQASEKMKYLEGNTIITCGDTPLITAEIYESILDEHINLNNDLTIMTTNLDDPFGYGRIVRDLQGNVLSIVEQKDLAVDLQNITEVNSGVYVVNNKLLFKHINEINNDNSQKEFYLPDLVQVFLKNNLKVDTYEVEESKYLIGVNTLIDLANASKIMQISVNEGHLNNGVRIIDPSNTYIGVDVKIGSNTVIYPNNFIYGNVEIGSNNIIKPSCYIVDSKIGDHNEIGPMAHLRGKTEVFNSTRVGNFVEMKNTKFGNGSKAAHLTYLGDSQVGENVNIGCGVITANYDGVNKFQTVLHDNSFIGSNVNLIAPVEIGSDSFIAAGTTVAGEIEKDKFVIGRSENKIKKNLRKKGE